MNKNFQNEKKKILTNRLVSKQTTNLKRGRENCFDDETSQISSLSR